MLQNYKRFEKELAKLKKRIEGIPNLPAGKISDGSATALLGQVVFFKKQRKDTDRISDLLLQIHYEVISELQFPISAHK